MMDLVVAELDQVHERIAGRFARAEPRPSPSQVISLNQPEVRLPGWSREHSG